MKKTTAILTAVIIAGLCYYPLAASASSNETDGAQNTCEKKGAYSNSKKNKCKAFMNNLKETNPEKYQELMDLRKNDKKQFRKEMREIAGKSFKNKCKKKMKEYKPLIKAYKNAKDEAAKEQIKKQLQDKLSANFDAKHQERLQHLTEYENRLKNMKDRIDQREKDKNEIISKHLNKMLGSDTGDNNEHPVHEHPSQD